MLWLLLLTAATARHCSRIKLLLGLCQRWWRPMVDQLDARIAVRELPRVLLAAAVHRFCGWLCPGWLLPSPDAIGIVVVLHWRVLLRWALLLATVWTVKKLKKRKVFSRFFAIFLALLYCVLLRALRNDVVFPVDASWKFNV